MKRLVSIFLLLLILAWSLPVFTAAAQLPLVIDNAELFTIDQAGVLEAGARSVTDKYALDVVILTEPSLSGASAHEYADAYYDRNGYADDGILLLLAMEEREWYISTCGDGRYAFSDSALSELGERMLPFLSDGRYYEAFTLFISSLPEYLDADLAGEPIDGDAPILGETVYDESGPDLLICLAIGLVSGLIGLLILRCTMNTKRPQRSAGAYLTPGSYRLYGHRDLFLYSSLSKTRRQQTNSGGGSSVHRSSGGRSHGGRGGKF